MDLLRQTFRDISLGCTPATVLSRRGWIKHLNYADQIGFDAKREEFYEEAKREGLPIEEAKLKQLHSLGFWTDQKELELAQAKETVTGLIEGKRKNAIAYPSMVKSYIRQIEAAEKDYETKLVAKQQLLDLTCESYAEKQVNDHYIVSNLFADPELTRPLFDDVAFQYLNDAAFGQLVADYRTAVAGCSDHNLKKLAMQPFFQRYFGLCDESVGAFFGCPISRLTFYQVDLLRYAGHFRHIYSAHDTSAWSADVKADPDLFTDYAESVTKAKERNEAAGVNDGQTSTVGLKKEDAKVLGVRNNMTSIQQMAKLGR